ncbi:MAG: leucine zipper domain-containing protein [Rhodomicrobium sp.]
MIERIRKQDCTIARAAEAAGVSERAAYKWLPRYRSGGAAALHNASVDGKGQQTRPVRLWDQLGRCGYTYKET